jgi:hypothetical protein
LSARWLPRSVSRQIWSSLRPYLGCYTKYRQATCHLSGCSHPMEHAYLASNTQPGPHRSIQSNLQYIAKKHLTFVSAHRFKNSKEEIQRFQEKRKTTHQKHPRYSGLKPVISPLSTRCSVIALITAAPNPEPSAAVVMMIGSCRLSLGQSKISPKACAH